MTRKYAVNAVIEINGVKHYPGDVLSLDGKFEEEIKANQIIPLNPENPQNNGGKWAETPNPNNPPKGKSEGGEGEKSQDNGEGEEPDKEPEKTGFTAEQIAEAAKKIG